MFGMVFPSASGRAAELIGMLFAFCITAIVLACFKDRLPSDHGRAFAVDGMKSAGKPRGAGIVFVLAFVLAGFLFGHINWEYSMYLLLTAMAMLTGYLDDAAKNPWGEYRKGLLDLFLAIAVTGVYVYCNGTGVTFLNGMTIRLPIVVYLILGVILVWTSINVTNCTDGVDGLSGTLAIITMLTFVGVNRLTLIAEADFDCLALFLVAGILAYLWFNSTPSILMMGDAGSRAMGFFIAIQAMKSGRPVLYIPIALVMMLDGGLGLVKVALLRFLKIRILTKVRTPLHDQVRKVMGWSNTQCVFRFAIIQIVIGVVVLYLASM